ncbi:unnamed protein product [Lymnaea stagnalis]|uniref:Uncharacterized protein n=1 Tax=Lymnaea stagnalis TaxID=6523 RepID=A0AAV2HRK9_LYMST
MSDKKKTVEVVVFENPQKRKKKIASEQEKSDNKSTSQPPGFNQKQAKYDIRKLGIYGMDKKNKDKAMVDLLVELGAKPPKNRCYHITEYQKMMKVKKQEEEAMAELERKAGIKKKQVKANRKRNKDDLLPHLDGQAGFYKDGVQFVKKLKR